MAIRGFMSAINRPEPVLWITLAAIPANALLVYILLFGAFGLPPLGLFGAGLGPPSSISACSWLSYGLPHTAGRSGSITCSAISGASTGG